MTFFKRNLWELLLTALRGMNRMFTDHGERVAFCMLKLCRALQFDDSKTFHMIFAALFHEIGAFKREDANGLLEFEAEHTYNHCLDGYLFLKYFSPLREHALPILYHHNYYNPQETSQPVYDGMLIHLCDRFDVLYLKNLSRLEIEEVIKENAGSMFAPDTVSVFIRLLQEGALFEPICQGAYRDVLREYFDSVVLPEDFAFDVLKMLVYTFETVSPSTIFHSALTAAYACLLGEEAGLKKEDCEELYVAGMVHDIGKIFTPAEILEKPSSLSMEEMSIMLEHPSNTYTLLHPYFDESLVRIASRHHERPNGSGYPLHLPETELTPQERIMAVSDVISALYTKRSYKDAFEAEAVKNVLTAMSASRDLDPKIVDVYFKNASSIDTRAQEMIEPVRFRYTEMLREYDLLKDHPIGY